VYVFNLAEASINKVGRWDQIKAWFKPPDIPRGWQRVDEPLPLEQAAQPIQAPR
jgi:hypothetical protein